jgi:hypothetical protein
LREQLRPIGETLIMPLRNSINVPLRKRGDGVSRVSRRGGSRAVRSECWCVSAVTYRFWGSSRSAIYRRQKFASFWYFSSPSQARNV